VFSKRSRRLRVPGRHPVPWVQGKTAVATGAVLTAFAADQVAPWSLDFETKTCAWSDHVA
jgi:hypothetical protein